MKTKFYVRCTHPILLPKNGTVTELLIRWCHEKTANGGRDITLSEIRSTGYWIIDPNSRTRKIIFKFVTCRSLQGRLGEKKWLTYHMREPQKEHLLLTVVLICLGHSTSRKRDQSSRDMEQCLYALQVELFTYR